MSKTYGVEGKHALNNDNKYVARGHGGALVGAQLEPAHNDNDNNNNNKNNDDNIIIVITTTINNIINNIDIFSLK